MTTQPNPEPQDLLQSTLQRLQAGVEHVSPANELIDQWSQVLGTGNLTLENVADELFELKKALGDGRAPEIAESLHTLSKFTKQASGESSDVDLVGQLTQLAQILDDASARIAQSR